MSIAFKVYVRCLNCQKDYGTTLCPPESEGSPADIDELLESNFLSSQRFTCAVCESTIATVTGVKELRDGALVRIQELCS